MRRSALVLLALLLSTCTTGPGTGTIDAIDVAVDVDVDVDVDVAVAVAVADPGPDSSADVPPDLPSTIPIPWDPAPPDPASVVADPPFVQELNHTWNEARWDGPLIGLVDPPAAWGWERPTLVTPRGVLLWDAKEIYVERTIPGPAPDLIGAVAALGAVYMATSETLYVLNEDGDDLAVYTIPEGEEIWGIQGYPDKVYLSTSLGLVSWDGEKEWIDVFPEGTFVVTLRQHDGRFFLASDWYVTEYVAGEGGLLMQPLRTMNMEIGAPVALLADVTLPEPLDFVLVGTEGIAGYLETDDGWARVDVPLFNDGRLPLAGARAARPDPNGGFVVAASGGAYRLVSEEFGPEWRVYVPERWMPDGDVRDVMAIEMAIGDEGLGGLADLGELWFATAKGPGWVTRTEWTLGKKTAPMIQRILDRHDRDGAVADSRLTIPGDLSTSIPYDSDNDGGWTCYWVLAECFRWKLTGDPAAKAHFDKSLDRMLSFRTLTGTDWFLARSVIRIDGCILDDCDDPDDGEWFLSPDEEWWVKADTSNDEVTSHMFMMGHAYDLCADDDQKAAIADHVAGIVGGIMDHGWMLLDPQDMEPTTHGQFEPFYVNDWPAGAWADGGRRSAQILGALNLAHYLTGEQRFLDGKAELIEEHHYDENVANVGDAAIYPFCAGSGDCDELALQAFMPLLRYETDPALREKWMTGWRRMWDHLKLQEDLYWEITNAVYEGGESDFETGMRWFRRYPTDLIRFPMYNQPRQDLAPPPDYYLVKDPDIDFFVRSDGHVLPPDERRNARHNTPQYSINGGWGSNREMDDADVLYTYWMGRYYGFIAAPE